MSDLRKQLESLASEYRTVQYPGDLAAEMFRPHKRHVGRWIASIAAVAAAIALTIFLHQSPTPSPMSPQSYEDNTEFSFLDMPPVQAPHLPDSEQYAPPAQDFSMSTPSFSMSDDDSSPAKTAT